MAIVLFTVGFVGDAVAVDAGRLVGGKLAVGFSTV